MFSFLDRTLIIFDTEYTDLSMNPLSLEAPEIVEIAGFKVSSDLTEIDRFTSLVRPKRLENWTVSCEKLTGIPQSMLEDAPSWGDVWKDWAEFSEYNTSRLMAWHAYADVEVLRALYKRNGLGYPHAAYIVDIASMAYSIFSYLGIRPKGWGLRAICNRLHISFSENHRALEDARLALSILTELQSFEETFLGQGDSNGFGNSPRSEGVDL